MFIISEAEYEYLFQESFFILILVRTESLDGTDTI